MTARRTRRARAAPSAARMAASWTRASERVNDRLARFEQAMNSTAMTAASRKINPRRDVPMTCSASGVTVAPSVTGSCASLVAISLTCA